MNRLWVGGPGRPLPAPGVDVPPLISHSVERLYEIDQTARYILNTNSMRPYTNGHDASRRGALAPRGGGAWGAAQVARAGSSAAGGGGCGARAATRGVAARHRACLVGVRAGIGSMDL